MAASEARKGRMNEAAPGGADGDGSRGTAYILSSNRFDVALTRQLAAADQKPDHHLIQLAEMLPGELRQPGDVPPRTVDRLLALCIARPEHWALARRTVRSASAGDLIYCNGEHTGIPVALVNAVSRRRAAVVLSVMAPNRPRTRVLLRLLALVRRLPPIVTGTRWKARYLRSKVKAPASSVTVLGEQVDERFFRPGDRGEVGDRQRPLIASGGLEQRDYATLAAAVEGLDVDVQICAVSPDFSKATTVAMPEVTPPNMVFERLEFSELRTLYQTADVTVVSLLANDYAAGSTVLLEAIACGCPVVVTDVVGFEELIERGLVVGVPVGDPHALRTAIQAVIEDPAAARRRADAAHEHFRANQTSAVYLDRLVSLLDRQRGASPGGERRGR